MEFRLLILRDRIPIPPTVHGDPVLTLSMVDELHSSPAGTAVEAFNAQADGLKTGTHYFELRDTVNGEALVVLTEPGYVALALTFSDPIAQEIYGVMAAMRRAED